MRQRNLAATLANPIVLHQLLAIVMKLNRHPPIDMLWTKPHAVLIRKAQKWRDLFILQQANPVHRPRTGNTVRQLRRPQCQQSLPHQFKLRIGQRRRIQTLLRFCCDVRGCIVGNPANINDKNG